MFLIAGRQLLSREGIEVLVIALEPEHALYSSPAGGHSAKELVHRGLDAGGIVVLPWGFGKWLGSRGRLVRGLADSVELKSHPLFFLGDILARCWPWPTPRVFRSQRVLPGTDILPLPGFEARLASYGFRIRGDFSAGAPSGSLLAMLRRRTPIESVGGRDSMLETAGNQVRYRVRGLGRAQKSG